MSWENPGSEKINTKKAPGFNENQQLLGFWGHTAIPSLSGYKCPGWGVQQAQPQQQSVQMSPQGAGDARHIPPRAQRVPHRATRELRLSSLPLWHPATSAEALKGRIVLKGGWQFQAAICHGMAHPSSPCNPLRALSSQTVLFSLAQRLQRLPGSWGNWPAFKISSQGLLNQLPCLCTLMAVCLVICCTLCTLCSSYRLAFYFLQQFLSLCQHLAICSFNAYR